MTPTASKIVLYSSWLSSCSYRVRICLNFKEINYQLKPVDLMKFSSSGSYSNEYVASPTKYVPALEIDGHTLFESMTIMQYVEETRRHNPLLPNDPSKRAQVRTICDIIVSGIQPLQNIAVVNRIIKHSVGENQEHWRQFWISRGFNVLEKILTETSGKYCVGDEITFADCCLVPQVFSARRFNVDLNPYPNILRIDKELSNIPAFQKAHPMSQEDFPKDKKISALLESKL